MVSPFDDLDQMISSTVLTAYGEAAIITPRTSSQYVERKADPNRSEANVWGVFSAGPTESDIRGQSESRGFSGTTRVGSMKAEFWISPEQIRSLGFKPQRGDTISFPGRCGSPVYAVAGLQHTDMGDLALILVREDQTE